MAGELLLDAGALVSLLDRSQTHHLKCRHAFADWTGPVVSTEAVLTEATHLLAGVQGGRAPRVDFFLSGGRACPEQCDALQCSARLEDLFVEDQITVRLPIALGRTLRRTSRRLGRRPSDVVRMALEAFLQGAPTADGKRAERLEHLIGSLSSGIPDLAERHREYVLASLKHGR